MKDVKIYSIGSCDSETRVGKYEALLEYGEHRKYLTSIVKDTTANRCIIEGLIVSVGMLKVPCNVQMISTTKLGLSGLRKNKGPNVDLLRKLIDLLARRYCEFEFVEEVGKGEEINGYIHEFSNQP